MSVTLLDPRAGTHFTGKIFVKAHALDRATEYFGVERAHAPIHVMDLLRKSALIDSDVIAEDGNRGRMFVYKRTAFIVAPTEDTVITLYPVEDAPGTLTGAVQNVLHAALRTAQRKESRDVKRLTVCKAELAVERAECELRRLKTASVRVVAQMDARLTEINEENAKIDAQIYDAKREKTTLAKGLCAYL